ncbi:MAG: purine-nucleoside phosphorylase [Tissierellia bacterium]|nr:purine-nucleoside phosphorylase [Tissierellia bacterium]
MTNRENLRLAVDYIQDYLEAPVDLALILGSGLGDFARQLDQAKSISYQDIPGFSASSVAGHSGELVIGWLAGKYIICMKGRIHYYEGHPMEDVVFPIRVLSSLGIDHLIVTNAAGGVNKAFKPGDLMVIGDHINFSGKNPLIGPNDEDLGPRFLDMSYAYYREGQELIKRVGEDLGIPLQEGTYIYFTGPSYETPAEVKMAGLLGADAVGMSTVPEVIVANHQGVKVLGISCITNMAAGILDQPLNHEEVMEVGASIQKDFTKLIKGIIQEL